ncbi:uncharacterized protein N7503_001677 [Penicillium pulvis]|uniref:uncharacterized protein n=1 Tax=Penicillium pulvis TaxID=1562058 RepID=UPI0025490695|nr:uncharacterized protein N7503_001677 [Penicillium pulvis]KAJ5809459.1 hypothetical protein N7503_001677 [Penicillium pulvis]
MLGSLHRCPVCGKEFTRSDARQRHEAIHKTQQSPSVTVTPQRRTESPKDLAVFSPQPSDALHEAPSVKTHNDDGSASLGSLNVSSLAENDVQHETGNSWSPMNSLNIGIQSTHILTAQAPTEHARHWANQSVENTFDDDLLRWIREPCLFEDFRFDEDIMAVLLDTGSMPPFNAAPILAMDLDYDQMAIDHSNQNLDVSIDGGGIMSRPASPPNEASEEDKWPYKWDPASQAITAAKPIELPGNHPLRRDHEIRFDISHQRYQKVTAFLLEPARRGFNFHSLHFPDLETTNIFIRLFFTRFEYQMPVIHRPSLQSCDDLPDPLLAAMIAIGAIYSRERHTCRFSIVLVDMARLSSQIALEMNNKLMRDPKFVYALTLICYAGLWCGNKRLFELSESLRAAVVTYCRQIRDSEFILAREDLKRFGNSMEGRWQAWILKESRKRLLWIIYSFDCMFPCLLYLPPSISVAEFMAVECPCDEEFWHAATANRWRSLLGSASVPPARTFASVVSPFMGPLDLGTAPYNTSSDGTPGQTSFASSIGLNSWTRHLVLTTILIYIYDLSLQISMISQASLDTEIWQISSESEAHTLTASTSSITIEPEIKPHYAYLMTRFLSGRHSESALSPPEQEVCMSLAKRKYVLLKMLVAWEQTYAFIPAPDVAAYETSRHFHKSARAHLRLAHLTVHVPILDLQNALGKSGTPEISPAINMMHSILTNHPENVGSILTHSLEVIRDLRVQQTLSIGESKSRMIEPPEIITCFLSEVFVWVVVICADSTQTGFLRDKLEEFGASDGFFAVVKEALACDSDQRSHKDNISQPNLIMFAAADVISKMTPWNASLNLALLLCHRGKACTTRKDQGHA